MRNTLSIIYWLNIFLNGYIFYAAINLKNSPHNTVFILLTITVLWIINTLGVIINERDM